MAGTPMFFKRINNNIRLLIHKVQNYSCVIGATKTYRRDDGLPHRFIVLQFTGFEDEIVCIRTENERIYAFSRDFDNREIADSFDEWFQRDIIEYYKMDRPNKYAGEKIIIDKE